MCPYIADFECALANVLSRPTGKKWQEYVLNKLKTWNGKAALNWTAQIERMETKAKTKNNSFLIFFVKSAQMYVYLIQRIKDILLIFFNSNLCRKLQRFYRPKRPFRLFFRYQKSFQPSSWYNYLPLAAFNNQVFTNYLIIHE